MTAREINFHDDSLGASFSSARSAFVARCDRDPTKRAAETAVLDKLVALSLTLGPKARFEPTADRKNVSLVFVRTCDGKTLWKAIVQQGERKLEVLPRGFFRRDPQKFAAFAAIWNETPLLGARLREPGSVATMPLRLVARDEVWAPIERAILWAAECP